MDDWVVVEVAGSEPEAELLCSVLRGAGIECAPRLTNSGVEIVVDPERISYRDILEFLFQIHDPTTKDRQGNDVGSAYRSEIFYTSDEQREVAEETIADVEASGLWPGKVVTEISQAVPFWEAEPEHQDYLQHYPSGYTCHYPRPGWKLPHRETAA
jgi:peptide-methionine (S)-S-oxide reductase